MKMIEQLVMKILLGYKKTAAKLVSLGVTSEDAVLVRSNNSYSFILLYFSIHYVGAKFVNVAPDSDVSYVSFIEDKVNPKLFIEKARILLET